ncbi:MAG: VWA domain-containing protein [Myxococcales bacterium]|nr:VWA domain-containing protein [Myxococcales bacterium]
MRHSFFALFLALLLALFGASCGSGNTGNGDGGGDPDGNNPPDGSNPTDTQGGDKGQDGGGGGGDELICNEVQFEANSVPPNLLLVVDKSGSMRDAVSATDRTTKLSVLKTAVNSLLDYGAGKIRFGWMQYPSDSRCGPGNVSVQIGDNSVQAIRNAVTMLSAGGGTPTGDSLNNANAYQGLHDTTRNNFVMLVTDGMPTCPNGNGEQTNEADNQLALSAVQNLRAAGIDTFVIGLGDDLNASNPDLLNSMADAGGHPRVGATRYYPANSVQELQAIFETIGGMVMGCNLALSAVPEYPAYLWVYFDGTPVPRNTQNGWEYDSVRNTINFYGSYCDMLRNGQVTKVDIKMGCRPPD